jgi:hypothetical protein
MQQAMEFPLTVGTYDMTAQASAGILTGVSSPDPSSSSGLSYTSCSSNCGTQIEVLTSGSVAGMPADVAGQSVSGPQGFDPTQVEAQVFLTDPRGVSQLIADCVGSGVCTDTAMNPVTGSSTQATLSSLPKATATALGPQLAINIDATALAASEGGSLTGDQLEVVMSSPWTQDVTTTPVTLGPANAAVASSSAAVSVSGRHTGTTFDTPDLSPPLGALSWEQYEGEMSFFSYIFGSSAAKYFTEVANQIVQAVLSSAFMGPVGEELMVGLSALKNTVFKAATEAVAEFGTSAAPRLTAAVSKIVNSDFVVAARTFVANRFRSDEPPGRLSMLLSKVANWSKTTVSNIMDGEYGAIARAVISAGCHGAKAFFRAGYTSVVKDPEFSSGNGCSGAATQAAMLSYTSAMGGNNATSSGALHTVMSIGSAIASWKTSWANVAARLIVSQGSKAAPGSMPSDNVGLGTGVALEFTQFFDAVVNTSVPGWTNTSASSIAVDLMSDPTSLGGGDFVANLTSCTGGNLVCSGKHTVTAIPIDGQLLIHGYFPQDVAWLPPGAWLRVTVRTPQGVYTARDDIAFPGYAPWSYNNLTFSYRWAPGVPSGSFDSSDTYLYLTRETPTQLAQSLGNLEYYASSKEASLGLAWAATYGPMYDPSLHGGSGWPG